MALAYLSELLRSHEYITCHRNLLRNLSLICFSHKTCCSRSWRTHRWNDKCGFQGWLPPFEDETAAFCSRVAFGHVAPYHRLALLGFCCYTSLYSVVSRKMRHICFELSFDQNEAPALDRELMVLLGNVSQRLLLNKHKQIKGRKLL